MKILIINGPNLNLLGLREPAIYGRTAYAELEDQIKSYSASHNIEIKLFQSNHEGAIVDEIQSAYDKFDGIVINPAAYTHTSIAILDALKAVALPAVEVHISNIEQREAFRQISYVREYCFALVAGKGPEGYIIALEKLSTEIKRRAAL